MNVHLSTPKIFFIIANLFILIFSSCSTNKNSEKTLRMNEIKHGDLIFVGAQTESLSGAINRVTQTNASESFDHIGLIEVATDGIYVLHSAPKGGSQRENILSFINNQLINKNILAVYRLQQPYQVAIPMAIAKAKTMLGKPYNISYVLNDEAYYCSDYVERAFRTDSIFKLEPMSFIDPSTGKNDTYWEGFYAELGMEVPTGELGCNPNGMAKSEKLIRIGQLKS